MQVFVVNYLLFLKIKVKNIYISDIRYCYSTFAPPHKTYKDFFKDAAWLHYCPHVLIAARAVVTARYHGLPKGACANKTGSIKYQKPLVPNKCKKKFSPYLTDRGSRLPALILLFTFAPNRGKLATVMHNDLQYGRPS